jgi:3-hydroxyacyl-[acyl-carrier-protein] dehydratase
MSENPYRLESREVQKYLPHRPPFLLVDRILEIHPNGKLTDLSPANMIGTRVVGIKNASMNEPHFQGHFPGFPVMPGVLMIETMAQVSSFSVYPYVKHDLERFAREFECILVGVDSVRFRKMVVPGDTIRVETEVSKCRGKLWAFKCVASVEGQKVAEAEILANLGGAYPLFDAPAAGLTMTAGDVAAGREKKV